MGKDGKNSGRVSITLSKQQHARLKELADKNDVAMSWLARKAIVRFIEEADGGPLLPLEME
ncbi:MAG: ribbon-helix-helix domain-containing protein [Oryzomonas sp.]|uniref:ribbon-helix-helix domain-containing protein n=1 Tax=Oryzomonas sp. TaxID=2855186 RepID=UPI00284A7352|nr:CopG family transcriptional regulator [Oryzomonas sp.]MDR3579216.1 ribbon-helix-helix domain-containing protein [Oryzomonas sp.]